MEDTGVPGALPAPCTPGYIVEDLVAELDEIPRVGGDEIGVEPPPPPLGEPGAREEVASDGNVDE
eukprot:12932009-Prorocentrum_lima.AAC.1